MVTVTVAVAPLLALGTEELIAVGLMKRMDNAATGLLVAEDLVVWIHGIELLYELLARECRLPSTECLDHSHNLLVHSTVKFAIGLVDKHIGNGEQMGMQLEDMARPQCLILNNTLPPATIRSPNVTTATRGNGRKGNAVFMHRCGVKRVRYVAVKSPTVFSCTGVV